jgi:hypothetical protein
MFGLGKEMDMNEAMKALEQFALDNYEEGGHWVVETHVAEDYQEFLDEAAGDMAKAKKLVREYWEFQNMLQRECY